MYASKYLKYKIMTMQEYYKTTNCSYSTLHKTSLFTHII